MITFKIAEIRSDSGTDLATSRAHLIDGGLRVTIARWILATMLACFAFRAAATDQTDWQVDLAKKQGLIQVLTAVNARHPGFLRSQMRYRANFIRLFRDAAQIVQQLGPLTSRALLMPRSPIFGLTWS